jgi:hypothetical protein
MKQNIKTLYNYLFIIMITNTNIDIYYSFITETDKNSILKYNCILRSLKHARFFGHDGAAGVFEIEQVLFLNNLDIPYCFGFGGGLQIFY